MSLWNSHRDRWRWLPAVVLCLALAPTSRAADSDLSVTNTAPARVDLGVPFRVTVGYANAGPDTATSAFVNAAFIPPTGLGDLVDDYFNGTGRIFDELQSTALGTDTLGNVPMLFWDDFYCENAFFQLQGDDTPDATPIQPLAPGTSGSFAFQVTLPMTEPKTGTVGITGPEPLVDAWTLVDPSSLWIELGAATTYSRYASTSCEKLVGGPDEDICQYIDINCWGARVSQLDQPIDAPFELADDASSTPTLACGPLVGFTPGSIAVVRRGVCEFGEKSFYAEQAGASAVFMVNDGRCSDFPNSDQCVINMSSGILGDLVTIPVILVSQADGEPVIAALDLGDTVTGIFGGSSTFATGSFTFLAGLADLDPDDTDNITATTSAVDLGGGLIFYDGFASGGTDPWSFTSGGTGQPLRQK